MGVLPRQFYERDVRAVARELLGKILEYRGKRLRITETEAYLGKGDAASHNKPVFYGQGGMTYVFLCYGVHWCLNVTAQARGKPGCVLIRGVEGISGPGRVTKWWGITGSENGLDVTEGQLRIWDDGRRLKGVKTGPRVGISKSEGLPLRFWLV